MNSYTVLRKPHLSEKAVDLKESGNKIVFKVHIAANRIQIKQAIEKIFKVKVESVRTMIVHGKKKRQGQREGKCADWKKAIITLKKGDTIEYFEGT